MSVLEDIKAADIKIKSGNNHDIFNINSSVYKYTNEFLCDYDYLFKNKENMLSIICSSDQILTAILYGCKNIDAFDISRFAKYFFYLKKAGIEVLSRNTYLEYFYGEHIYNSKSDYQVLLKVLNHLDNDSYIFFDYLLSNYSFKEIYESKLFVEPIKEKYSRLIKRIRYLNELNFIRLRYNLKDININMYVSDIRNFEVSKAYDLIYLSNVEQYINTKEYLDILKKFKLSLNGVMINYFFGLNDLKKSLYEFYNHKQIRLSNYDSVMIKTR